ncbi:MAG: ABC transporter substrate-binding protein [Pseudomonadota bacterium]
MNQTKRAVRLAASTALVALIAAGSVFVATDATAEDPLQIRIGTEGAYPPFNSLTADGDLVGFDIDIANALCEEMQAECEFVVQDWDGMIPALLANKFDAIIASMSITEERMERIDFSGKYYNTPPAIAVPKDSEIAGVAPEDLADITIGAQSATTHSNYAEEKFPDTELRLYPTPDEYKLDIAAGRIDAVIDDVVVLSEWINSDDGACCMVLDVLVPDPVINGIGAGIGVRKGEEELRDAFSAAIQAIRDNGTYEEINNKYFDFDVYGG